MESAMRILNGLGICVNRYLAEHYQLSTDSGTLPAIRQCGGCPHCRAHRLAPVVARQPVQPMFDGALAVPPRPALRRLAPEGRLCVWTDGPQPAAEQELVDRLVSHGVMALVAAGPWSPPPRAARIGLVGGHGRGPARGLRRPARPHAGPRGGPGDTSRPVGTAAGPPGAGTADRRAHGPGRAEPVRRPGTPAGIAGDRPTHIDHILRRL